MTQSGHGRVLLLIGPSSVGKTALARELQRQLSGLWLSAGVDLFWGMLDELDLPEGEFRTDSDVMRRITRGWHRAVATLAAEGNDVIVDELWTHRWWLEDWREVLEKVRWWSVMLTADPATLAAREAERGDRPEGLAIRDLEGSPDPAFFDLVIDTTHGSIEESARAVLTLLHSVS